MFRGQYFHTIDPKGRLSIPAKFREALRKGAGGMLVIANGEHCLEVYPQEAWERLEAKVRGLPTLQREVQHFTRLYLSSGVDAEIDGQGRILIPPASRESAGLTKEVALVGVIERFEIWSRERWEEFQRTHRPELPALLEKLSSLGV
jgi:MraZ protein